MPCSQFPAPYSFFNGIAYTPPQVMFASTGRKDRLPNIEETRVFVFRDEEFMQLCQSNHDVGYPVMRELSKAISRRLVATRLQLLDLFANESGSR